MTIYRRYRKLKNYIGSLRAMDSLIAIHAYSRFLEYGTPLPKNVKAHEVLYDKDALGSHPHLWELELLAKEVLLHGSLYATRSLTDWDDFAGALNRLRDFENFISGSKKYKNNVLFELHRIAHRQFIWQHGNNTSLLLRYFKILGHPAVEPILRARVGLSATALYRLGMGFVGHFMDAINFNGPVKVGDIGLTQEEMDIFVKHFSSSLSDLACTRFRRHRVRCFMEQEVCHGETSVYARVQA